LQITLTLHEDDTSKDPAAALGPQDSVADAETANDVDTAAAEPVVKTTDLDLNCISHLIKKQGPLGALKHVISYGENVGLGATTLTMSAIAIARHQEDASKTISEGNSTDKNADSSLRIFMAASKSAKERHQVDRQTLLMFVRNCVLFKVRLKELFYARCVYVSLLYAQSMPVDAANRLVSTMTVRSFQDRDFVFSAGDKGQMMYVIISGAVRVYVGSTNLDSDEALEIARLGEMGQSFGELALYSSAPRSATCIADGKLETLVLEKEQFLNFCPQRIISEMTTFGSKSAEKLCQALLEPVRKRSAVAEIAIIQFLRRVKFFENLPSSTIALLSQVSDHGSLAAPHYLESNYAHRFANWIIFKPKTRSFMKALPELHSTSSSVAALWSQSKVIPSLSWNL